jgi:hypothetical protein
MDTIKLKAPEGVTAASFGGQEFKVGKDGIVTVPVDAALQLYSFGFGNAPSEEKPAKAKTDAPAA